MALGWEVIRAEVLTRIRARDWPPGGLIPTEETLAQEFRCARATVSRALRDLADAGVLERKRKAGTRVAALPVRKATLDIPVIRREIAALGQTARHHVLAQSTQVPPVPVASRMGLGPQQTAVSLETLHLADGQPFAYETRWLNPAVLPALPDFTTISANEWLVTHVTYTTGDIAFSAAPATPRDAEVLGVAPGAALFITDRATFAHDRAITLVRLAHAPGYRLQTTL